MNLRDKARREWHARFDNRKDAKAKAGKLEVKAVDTTTTEMMLYDEIGFWGVTAKQFNEALNTVTTPNIRLRINSPGGDVFDGMAIYNALKAHKASVAVVVDGIAASAASFIAMAGETITMGNPSMMMIHRAMTFAIGNVNDMNATAAILSKVDDQIAAMYAAKNGKPAAEMIALMDAETWLTAQEAGALGLVDEVLGDDSSDDPCCDPESPDYNPDDPECDCPEEAKAEAKKAFAAKSARLRAARLVSLGIK